ncbi:MAG: VOC family protein [Chloroflexi bacterium]|nr:VOC family protein [Chloroflexota bacterium]
MATLPIQRLYHASVVVNDARATAQHYARLLGITRWEVHHWTPWRLTNTHAYGYRAEFGYTTATGRNARGVTFRLVQPTHGFSTYTEYLITRGEGVHSLCATMLPPRELESLLTTLAQQHDLSVAQSFDGDGQTSVMFDTRRALGGFFVEVINSAAPLLAADEVWDFSSEDSRPDGVGWLAEIPRVDHFGVAVSSLTEKLPAYARLLGVSRWSGVHFHNTPGGLEHATFDGRVVDNAWLLAITDVADFGLELLQGTREPTDYQRTVQRIGEGIHHILVRRGASDEEWWAVRDWMESMNIGVVMSGRVRYGAGEFFYLDTRAALGGYLLEVLVSREPAGPSLQAPANWRFDFDFTSKV